MLRRGQSPATQIAYLLNPANPIPMRRFPVLEKAAGKANKEIVIVHARGEHELNAAFAQIIRDRAGAVLLAQDSVFDNHLPRIGALALQHKLPSVLYGGSSANGLVSYARDGSKSNHSAATMAVKIFKGTKPADIPIEQPTHFTIIVNLKIAKALGITIPPTVMVQATRVIE